MTTLVLTGYDDAMRELGDLTSPLMLAYASRHGFDFKCFRDFPAGKPAYWHKIPHIIRAMRARYDRILWLDADQAVTNPDWVPPEDWYGFNASQDWGVDATELEHFSMCGFTCTQSVEWLFQSISRDEIIYINGPFPEQTPARKIYREIQTTEVKGAMTIHPRRVFNAVPVEVHQTVVDPWQPGDFCAHITMLPIPERAKLFHEIKKQANI